MHVGYRACALVSSPHVVMRGYRLFLHLQILVRDAVKLLLLLLLLLLEGVPVVK